MDTSKICSSCLEHFDFARPDLMEGIRKLKRQALEDAIRGDYGDVEIQKLRNDLQRYERTNASGYGNGVPCPWNPSQPVEITFPVRSMLSVWNLDGRSRSFTHLCESLNSTGCQLCKSLIIMIRYVIGRKVPDSIRLSSIWVFKKGGTLPSMLQFRVYADEACSHLSMIFHFYCCIDGIPNCKRAGTVAEEPLPHANYRGSGPRLGQCRAFAVPRRRQGPPPVSVAQI